MDYPCGKRSFSRTHTHTHTHADESFTPATFVDVSNYFLYNVVIITHILF